MSSLVSKSRIKDKWNRFKEKYQGLDAGTNFKLLGIFLIFMILYQETIMYIMTRQSIWTLHFLSVIFFAVTIGVFIWGILVIVPAKARRIVANIFLAVCTILLISQLIYFSFFRTYFILSSIGHGGQIVEFMDIILKLIWQKLAAILLLLLPLLLFIFIFSKKKSDFKVSIGFKRFMPLIFAAGIFITFSLAMFFGPKNYVARDYYFYLNRPYEASEFFGTYGVMGIDLRNSIYMFENTSENPGNNYSDPALPTMPAVPVETDPGTSGTESGDTEETDPVIIETDAPVAEPVPNILNIDFDSLADGRNSDVLAQMDRYFANVEPTMQNEYTGICEGYNLIVITAESFSRFVPDPDLTPTLYKMMTEGFHLKNFYNPIWSVSTYDGEYVMLTSLYPKDGVWSLYQIASKDQAFSYPHRLPDYNSYAFHNHTYNYYSRDVSHPAMGYDYYALGQGLDVKASWPESDLEMMEKSVDMWIDQEPFNIYYLTVSGHAAYTRLGNAMSSKNWHRVEDLPLSDEARCYLAANLELEDAMTYLLDRLRDAGVADHTLIVLGADHYPYGLSDETLDEFNGGELDHQFELYRSSGIIYVDGMEPVEISKPCANIDFMPTIYNLLGVPYDSRLLMGRDILSDSPGLVIFSNLSWISEYGRYNSSTKEFEVSAPFDPDSIPENYVQSINDIVRNRFYFSRLILDENYYAKIAPLAE